MISRAAAAAVACVLMMPASAGAAHADAFALASRLGRGINILDGDPIWKDPAHGRFTAHHFAVIHQAGFQTVRVVAHGFAAMDANDELNATFLATLDWAVHTALANGLNVVIDEHDSHACGSDAAECGVKLMAFWRQLAGRYRSEPDGVLFEILNEPNGALTPAKWNHLARRALQVIRASNPTRGVIVGPGEWNAIDGLDALTLPESDRNIIVDVHYYTPMRFTHQGASWYAEGAHVTGIGWGSPAELARLKSDFARAQGWAGAHHRPIFLGEFGAYDKGAIVDRARWTNAVAREAEARHWAWAYWQFDSDFIAYDFGKDQWVAPILRALVPR